MLANPVALSMLGVQPMLTILKIREGFILAENGFKSQGKTFEGREKIFSIREKYFSFCSEKKQKNLQIFTVSWQFSPMKISIFKQVILSQEYVLTENQTFKYQFSKTKVVEGGSAMKM